MNGVDRGGYDTDDKNDAQSSPDDRTDVRCLGPLLHGSKFGVVACILVVLAGLFTSKEGVVFRAHR